MFVDIALQFILATIIGSIWAAPFVITPAARRTLDKEALKFFLRSFFFRLNLFLIVFLGLYLGIFYFFKLGTYELLFSNYETLLACIMIVTIFLNLFNDRKKQETQINSINMYLKEIVNDFSPYDVSVNRINKLINPSSKAN